MRDAVLGIGGPLVSLAVATYMLAALTGSAGGPTIAPNALAGTYSRGRRRSEWTPTLLDRAAAIRSGSSTACRGKAP
jgi:hypothetical protein